MSVHAHRRESAPRVVSFAVVTLSDTRGEAEDRSGRRIIELIEGAGHRVAERRLLRDEPDDLRAALDELCNRRDVDAIVTTGGTGIAPRDHTVDVVRPLLEPELPGFGELFRVLSFRQVGAAAMLSRATAGFVRGKPLFALPGSTAACELAMTRLVLPEIGHLLSLRSDRPAAMLRPGDSNRS